MREIYNTFPSPKAQEALKRRSYKVFIRAEVVDVCRETDVAGHDRAPITHNSQCQRLRA